MSTTQAAPLMTNADRPVCVNTIARFRLMRSTSQVRHPGTPMGSPLWFTPYGTASCAWTRDPIWPNRDRLCSRNGHASMLLWSVLHLTKTQAVNAEYEKAGAASVSSKISPLSPARQQRQRAIPVPLRSRRRDNQTAARPRRRHERGMAITQKWLPRITHAWFRDLRLQHLRCLRR